METNAKNLPANFSLKIALSSLKATLKGAILNVALRLVTIKDIKYVIWKLAEKNAAE